MSTPGRIRIIAGTWRGRKIPVPDRPGLRPTADRVRETLFNWLSPTLHGAMCLDLFGGTGALSFEAVSRGAAGAVLIERDFEAAAALRETVLELNADTVKVVLADALEWLGREQPRPFDIVFVDPPFGDGHIAPVLEKLTQGWLKDHGQVYLESEKIPILRAETHGWEIAREGKTKHVAFALLERARQ